MGCFPLFFRKNLLSCCQDWMWKWYFVKQTSKLLSFCLILPPPQGQKMLSWPLQDEAAESTSRFRRLFWQSDLQLGKKIIWLGFETKLWIYLHSHTDWIVNPACCQSPKRGICKCRTVKGKGLNINLRGGQPSENSASQSETSALSIT